MTTLPSRSRPSEDYRSAFSRWEERSSVRVKPRRILEEVEQGKVPFPPGLVPLLYHPLVREQSESVISAILLRRLHVYLDFTADLEQLVVTPTTQLISRRRSGFDLPEEMLSDSYKICTDEVWHAQFSDDLQRQLVAATGLRPKTLGDPYFMARLSEIKAELDTSLRPLADVFFTTVSETLISGILGAVPRDQAVFTAVRETVADHAEDEGRHHAYFTRFFEYAWPQLTASQRETMGALLPEFAVAFLKPDLAAMVGILEPAELDPDAALAVIEETYPDDRVHADMRAAAGAMLRLFERNGVFASARAADAFGRCGLLS